MDLILLKREVMELTDLIASAVVEKINPVADEISTRQAVQEFGRNWLTYHSRRGHVSCHRVGPYKNSRKVWSRRELLAIKEAERREAKMIIKD